MSGLSRYLLHTQAGILRRLQSQADGIQRTGAVEGWRIYHRTPQICNKCRVAWVTNSTEHWQLTKPSSNRSLLRPSYRHLSSIPPRMDLDVERLQRSMKGMNNVRPERFDGDRLVYELKAANYVYVVSTSFYITALAGLYMAPDIIVGAWEVDTMDANIAMNLLMLVSGIVVLPVLLRLFVRRLVLKLYHNEAKDTYLTVVSRAVFGVTKKRFKGSDVISTHENSFERAFRLTSFRVNGTPFFVNSSYFKLPSDYNKLMRMT